MLVLIVCARCFTQLIPFRRFDGFIVCEEHKDILLAAWDEEQEIQREREAEVRLLWLF